MGRLTRSMVKLQVEETPEEEKTKQLGLVQNIIVALSDLRDTMK